MEKEKEMNEEKKKHTRKEGHGCDPTDIVLTQIEI